MESKTIKKSERLEVMMAIDTLINFYNRHKTKDSKSYELDVDKKTGEKYKLTLEEVKDENN